MPQHGHTRRLAVCGTGIHTAVQSLSDGKDETVVCRVGGCDVPSCRGSSAARTGSSVRRPPRCAPHPPRSTSPKSPTGRRAIAKQRMGDRAYSSDPRFASAVLCLVPRCPTPACDDRHGTDCRLVSDIGGVVARMQPLIDIPQRSTLTPFRGGGTLLAPSWDAWSPCAPLQHFRTPGCPVSHRLLLPHRPSRGRRHSHPPGTKNPVSVTVLGAHHGAHHCPPVGPWVSGPGGLALHNPSRYPPAA